MAFVSKISKAREVYEANQGLSRNALVDLLIATMGLNKGTATTYYYTLIKGDNVEAKKPVVVAAPVVEAAPKKRGRPAKVVTVDPILAAFKKPVEAPKPVVKVEAPKVVVSEDTGLESRRKAGRGVDTTRVSVLEADYNKCSPAEKATWSADIARYSEEYKNKTLFGKN